MVGVSQSGQRIRDRLFSVPKDRTFLAKAELRDLPLSEFPHVFGRFSSSNATELKNHTSLRQCAGRILFGFPSLSSIKTDQNLEDCPFFQLDGLSLSTSDSAHTEEWGRRGISFGFLHNSNLLLSSSEGTPCFKHSH